MSRSRSASGEWLLALDERCQRIALEILHDDERLGRELPEVVNRDDVRVVQGRGRSRFARELLGGIAAVEVALEHLERDQPSQIWIVGDIDGRHPAAAEATLDFDSVRYGHLAAASSPACSLPAHAAQEEGAGGPHYTAGSKGCQPGETSVTPYICRLAIPRSCVGVARALGV